MAKRRGRKTVKQAEKDSMKQTQIKNENVLPLDQEVERQSAAVRAIRDVEIEHSLTALRLLRSYFSEEQLQTPVLQFFKENLPNISVVKNEEDGQFEVQWEDRGQNLSMNHADGKNIHASLLQRLSIAYPHRYAIPPINNFLSSEAGRTNLLGPDSLQFKDFVLEGPSDSQMLKMQDALWTPGVSSQRLSIGMTPKTVRYPKPGEMLLSIHGSPLGVYKEDNMGAINESEEG